MHKQAEYKRNNDEKLFFSLLFYWNVCVCVCKNKYEIVYRPQ